MAKSKNNTLTTVVRYVLGIALVFFGLNGFFQFMTPPSMNAPADAFMQALFATKYMMVVVALIFLVTGIMLLVNKYVPLALVLLAPVTVNIILFHVFLHFASITFGLIMLILQVYLMAQHMDSYKAMLKA